MRAIITGASKGIGAAIARELAHHASALVLVGRTEHLLLELEAELHDSHPACQVIVSAVDITSEATVQELMAMVKERLGGFDVLVNCAGMAIPPTSVQETTAEVWTQIFAINALAPFLMTREAIPLLRESKRAAIVNIASTAGTSARPGWSAYAASKAALVNFSNTMAEELKPDGINVHCLAPGRTATELRRVLAPDEDPTTIMQPDAVARIVSFLVTTDGDVLKGQTIFVRGE